MPSTATHPAWRGPADPLDLECSCARRDSAYCYLGQHTRCRVIVTRGPETYLSTRGRTHTAVWLADRVCRWRCDCSCHQKPVAKAAPMEGGEAAWVREHVWTQHMRRAHENVPGASSACACQYGSTQHCQREHHDVCHRGEALPSPEGYITRPTGQVVSLPGSYKHPTPSATGTHHVSAAQVWLADRVCRWVCPCECHTEPEPEEEPAPPPPPEPEPSQPTLF